MKNKIVTLFLTTPIVFAPYITLSSCNDGNKEIFAPHNLLLVADGLTSLTASWDSVDNASGYYLDLSTNEQFTKIVSPYKDYNVGKQTSFKLDNLSKGTKYFLRLRSYRGKKISEYSNIVNCYTRIDKPAITEKEVNSDSSFSFSWSPVYNAEYYVIDIAYDSSFTSYVPGWCEKSIDKSKEKLDVFNLSPNTSYFVRMRATLGHYITENSNVIEIKTLTTNPTLPEFGEYNFGDIVTAHIENWVKSMKIVCSNKSCIIECSENGNFTFTNGCVNTTEKNVTISMYDKFDNLLSEKNAICHSVDVSFAPISATHGLGGLNVKFGITFDTSLVNNYNFDLYLTSSCFAMVLGHAQWIGIDNKQDAFLISRTQQEKAYGWGWGFQDEPMRYKLNWAELKIKSLNNKVISVFEVENIEIGVS